MDYPGHVAATVFTAGCNLRCPYCHNPELVSGPPPDGFIPAEDVLRFLARRSTVLEGVCITGGEPLAHDWIGELADRIHALGLLVKLDTNGMIPARIEAVAADCIALDVKTSPERYRELGGSPVAIRRSIDIVRETAPECRYRTTVIEPVVCQSDIRSIVQHLKPGDRYTLAAFRPGTTLDPGYRNAQPPDTETLECYADIARQAGVLVTIRDHRTALKPDSEGR